jgi:VWFA-related protein
MVGFRSGISKLAYLLVLLGSFAVAQQSIPDAPKPKDPPPGQFPDDAPPAPKNTRGQEQPPAVASATPPVVKPQSPDGLSADLKQFGKISVTVNFIQVPVTVRDNSGHMVPGLSSDDFGVYEDGVVQKLGFFTSDPFPLSAAIVIDTDLPSGTMKKINETLPALIAAFSEFDEVALYRYGHTVSQVSGFSGAANVSTATLTRIKRPGREGGPPAVFGPMASGPTVNGHPVNDPNAPGGTSGGGVTAPFQESYVLNDAILRAATDLSRRDRTRRKIIFVVSDGREMGSTANYDEVKRVLLSHNIAVYALGVDTAAMPIYDKLNRVRMPGFGYGNILPRYVSDTAGQMFSEFDRQSIEQAYARITDVARNQYTLGYYTRATAASGYRRIEVRVHRPNLSVYAKDGYYPLPPAAARP